MGLVAEQKKEVQDQIAAMETELAERHRQEMAAFQSGSSSSVPGGSSSTFPETSEASSHETGAIGNGETELTASISEMSVSQTETTGEEETAAEASGSQFKKGRQARRKEKKAAMFEEMRKQAEAEAAITPNYKEIERVNIEQLATSMKLSVKEISPDGHCLYNALADQLKLHDPSSTMTYRDLRRMAAEYMSSHSDDFIPFLVNDQGDMYTQTEFVTYCQKMQDEAVWGGQLEIQALSQSLQRQIHVIQSGSPVIKVGESFTDSPVLKVSYHRHAYGLGEHYNSLVPQMK
eukprot:jgi/Hompol1/6922/HPOL_005124-RA